MSMDGIDIAIIDDEAAIRDSLRELLTAMGHRPRTFAGSGPALRTFAEHPPELVLLDLRMQDEDGIDVLARLRAEHPESPVIMVSGHGTMQTAIEAMRSGAADFLTKPIRQADLAAALARAAKVQSLERDRDRLRANLARVQDGRNSREAPTFIGRSQACAAVSAFLQAAERLRFDSVLLVGETGTGKDVVARELHRRMHRDEAPFVVVNCPALPDTLVESELFGHMKGAFTGADADRPGAFELADGGTLLLDELGDLSPGAQAKLLRALEARQVRRLGGRRDIVVSVTVIAATNRSLPEMVELGTFRRDLLYRLNAIQLELPPLRDRPEDIIPLAEHFLRQAAIRHRRDGAAFTPRALAALRAYRFPGNVRELRNLVERAVLLGRDERLDIDSLALSGPVPAPAVAMRSDSDEASSTRAALARSKWNRRAAAKELGISYDALRWRIRRYGLGD